MGKQFFVVLLLCVHMQLQLVELEYVSEKVGSLVASSASPNISIVSWLVHITVGAFFAWWYDKDAIDESPCASWSVDKWERYFFLRFKDLSQEEYVKQVVNFYEGYQFDNFCRYVSQLNCQRHLLYELEQFIISFQIGVHNHSYMHDYFFACTYEQQMKFLQGAHYVLAAYNHKEHEAVNKAQSVASFQCKYQDQEISKEDQNAVANLIHYYTKKTTQTSTLSDSVIQNRLKGLSAYCPTSSMITVKAYVLDVPLKQLIVNHDISYELYEQCVGQLIQHIIHGESLAILHACLSDTVQPLCQILMYLVDLAREYNVVGDIAHALAALDICWSMLFCVKAGIEGFQEGMETFNDICQVMAKKLIDLIKTHPAIYRACAHVLNKKAGFYSCNEQFVKELKKIKSLSTSEKIKTSARVAIQGVLCFKLTCALIALCQHVFFSDTYDDVKDMIAVCIPIALCMHMQLFF